MKPLRKKMIHWMERKNYSASTIKCYVTAVSMLARYYGKCPSQLTEEEVADYLNFITKKRGYSYGSISGAHSGIKLFWKQILGREWDTRLLPRPKRPKELPEILSEQEVKLLIERTRNGKHKAIFRLLYSTGLRMGELVNLKPGDIDSQRMVIRVRKGKGKKDRYTILTQLMYYERGLNLIKLIINYREDNFASFKTSKIAGLRPWEVTLMPVMNVAICGLATIVVAIAIVPSANPWPGKNGWKSGAVNYCQ